MYRRRPNFVILSQEKSGNPDPELFFTAESGPECGQDVGEVHP
jgi:hypothetical protein